MDASGGGNTSKGVEIGGAVRLVVGVIAAITFQQAGLGMRELESISGDSVAEAFYHEVGLFSYGMAVLSLLLGV